ncbi:hypothetical protein Q8A73_001869 [Channa argus]|nr:hypothetical protein Q8A73_001869 [Channa argus]
MSHQKQLPKMPVPPLKQTCELYLSVLETILKADELNHTKKLVEEFMKAGGVGERLQQGLERKAHNTENWLTDDYLKYECLNLRKPVVICLNFGVLCTTKDTRDKQGEIRTAAEFIARILDINTMVDNQTLPVDYMRGKPLCMKQYEQVFSSCRIPGPKTDSLLFFAKSSNPPKHITAVHNGQFFALDVYNSHGTPLTVEQLCVQLERIYSSSKKINTEPVGILTTLQRDLWSKSYNSLMQDENNRESMSAIQSSIFTVCLDGPMPPVSDEMSYRRSGLLQALHGGGSQLYSGNRWFDKGLQVIIGEDGTLGINCGHAAADGSVLMEICDYAVANMKTPPVMHVHADPLPMPRKLQFNITPEIKQDIEEAKQHIDRMIQSLVLKASLFDHFGKNTIKGHRMSPNAFVQMAIQLAYYRVYKKCCSMMEPASMRVFRLGRIAMIPSNSIASVAFVKAFDDPKKQNLEKVELLEKALEEHRKRTEMVMRGQAIGVHFLGLLSQALEAQIPMPDIFTDTSFSKAFDFYEMTTSQLTTKTQCLTCACIDQPGVHDVNYSIMDNHIDVRVSFLDALDTCKGKDPTPLSQALEDALLDMMDLLEKTPRVKR